MASTRAVEKIASVRPRSLSLAPSDCWTVDRAVVPASRGGSAFCNQSAMMKLLLVDPDLRAAFMIIAASFRVSEGEQSNSSKPNSSHQGIS